jgi:hypothetical protein
MDAAALTLLLGSIGTLIGTMFLAAATYRNSVRKVDFDRVLENLADVKSDYDRVLVRLAESEARLAKTESRANDAEHRAGEYRDDIQRLGRSIEHERTLANRNLAIVAQDAQSKIEKMLLLIEDLYHRIETETGRPPNVDLGTLRKMIGLIDHVTGPLGQIDLTHLPDKAGASY